MPPTLQPGLRSAARNIAQSSKPIRLPCKRKLHQTLPLSAIKFPQDGGNSGPSPFGIPIAAVPAAEFKKFLEQHTKEASQDRDEPDRQADGPPNGDEPPSQPDQAALFRGSALRRRQRATTVRDTQKASIRPAPQWLLDRNVQLVEERQALSKERASENGHVGGGSSTKSFVNTPEETVCETAKNDAHDVGHQTSSRSIRGQQEIFEAQLCELKLIARSHIRLPTSDRAVSESPRYARPHFILSHKDPNLRNSFTPEIWQEIIEDLAASLDCDLLTLDAQDVGDLIAHAGLGHEITSDAISLSYDISAKIQRVRDNDQGIRGADPPYANSFGGTGWGDEEADDANEFEEVTADGQNSPFSSPMVIGKAMTIDLTKVFGSSGATRGESRKQRGVPSFISSVFDNEQGRSGSKHENHIFGGLVNGLLSAAAVKRSQTEGGASPVDVSESIARSIVVDSHSDPEATFPVDLVAQKPDGRRKKLIIYIQAIHCLEDHNLGQQFLSELYEQVQRRRNSGQEFVVIGAPPFLSYPTNARWHEGGDNASDTVLLTPPDVSPQDVTKVMQARAQQMTATNFRNLRTMLETKWNTDTWVSFSPRSPTFLEDVAATASMPETRSFWKMHYVQRLAAAIWGMLEQDPLRPPSITDAIQTLERSDLSKTDWLKQQTADGPPRQDTTEDSRIGKIRSSATKHEKALLAGVIEPTKISVTFKDVHAPFETIEAIQTLTTLSLVRPEAFRYGVLASDRLPGLLLYGPPGTGKTLLAKAVAKESRATVLSVSSAQLNDMYVGEGEKNVAALFSLAKKLTPCIIFLDEADAIFSARGNRGSRVNHRELLNQFLTEWDGMSNDASGAFIMVATNRPMDLDDAVLRRLPRRLLVDLPTESDRLAILKIHLRDEVLAEGVDFPRLAKQTPFYSGSDLKNLAVAAALECVREENEAAKRHTGDEAYKYAEKRTLTAQHFEKALSEISASISEDMSSLGEIKKFDDQYGDKRGRKRKPARWGFTTAAEAEKVLDTVKVRS